MWEIFKYAFWPSVIVLSIYFFYFAPRGVRFFDFLVVVLIAIFALLFLIVFIYFLYKIIEAIRDWPERRILNIRSDLNLIDHSEWAHVDHARRLVTETKDILASSSLAPKQRAELLRQLNQVPENIIRALGKLQRLRRVKEIAKSSGHARAVLDEIAHLEAQILAGLRNAYQTLLAAPVTLMKLDLARGDRDLQHIIAELGEANQRLRDLAESYEALHERRI